MKIATWNVNSVRQREDAVLRWLDQQSPDVLCLQELKCQEAQFPASIRDTGYHCVIVGQKAYNGVAILSRSEPDHVMTHLPDFSYEEARYAEVSIGDVDIGNLYLPNGNSGGIEGFAKKCAFFEALTAHARRKLDQGRAFVFLGDYNLCPTDQDFAPSALLPDDALIRPESRAAWRRLIYLGLTDAMRALHPHQACYTYWDYQAGALQRDRGLRIDHALLSAQMADRLVSAEVDKAERCMERASDHAPTTFGFRQA